MTPASNFSRPYPELTHIRYEPEPIYELKIDNVVKNIRPGHAMQGRKFAYENA